MVGNTVGEQALLDLRNKKCLGKYKGGAGAIRGLQIHPTLPVVVSCGLDRYVRIHDMNTRLITQKVSYPLFEGLVQRGHNPKLLNILIAR